MSDKVQLNDSWLLEALRCGELSAESAVSRCLQEIECNDRHLQSFVSLRPEAALAEARQLDAVGRPDPDRHPLRGLPFAAKDVFDTHDLPTEYGSPYYRGFQPARDAAAVERLRQAGAILIGKTSTVEFAGIGALPPTRNPHHAEYSPGGSSSGSGAAVGGGLGEGEGNPPGDGVPPRG